MFAGPDPRHENKVELIPKLMPTCQTLAADGMQVDTRSPKAIANQKAAMEYLLAAIMKNSRRMRIEQLLLLLVRTLLLLLVVLALALGLAAWATTLRASSSEPRNRTSLGDHTSPWQQIYSRRLP